jgi:hypothetical protein
MYPILVATVPDEFSVPIKLTLHWVVARIDLSVSLPFDVAVKSPPGDIVTALAEATNVKLASSASENSTAVFDI